MVNSSYTILEWYSSTSQSTSRINLFIVFIQFNDHLTKNALVSKKKEATSMILKDLKKHNLVSESAKEHLGSKLMMNTYFKDVEFVWNSQFLESWEL